MRSFSRWQKLRDRMTEKVVVLIACADRAGTAAPTCTVPEASALSLIAIG